MRKSLIVGLSSLVLVTGSLTASAGLQPSATSEIVNCAGDGHDGNRVSAVYLYPAGTQNNYDVRLPVIRRALSRLDKVWDSAADPYDQHPRWLCRPTSSRAVVTAVQGPPIGSDRVYTFAEVVRAMKAAGYSSSHRVYLIFADSIGSAFPYGGKATTDDDDRRTSSNLNNIGPGYAMVDGVEKGWEYSVLALGALHELGHALGAVQCSAPHSSCRPAHEVGHHHCWDEYDVMCYDDGGSYYWGSDRVDGTADDREPVTRCSETSSLAAQWDCGKDDYFNIAPAAGSYLATHWNLAISSFVTRPRPE
jgi:hypothetical protein